MADWIFQSKISAKGDQIFYHREGVFGYQARDRSISSLPTWTRVCGTDGPLISLTWLDKLKDENMGLARWNLTLQQYTHSQYFIEQEAGMGMLTLYRKLEVRAQTQMSQSQGERAVNQGHLRTDMEKK